MSQPEKYRSGNQSEENRNRFKILIGTQKNLNRKKWLSAFHCSLPLCEIHAECFEFEVPVKSSTFGHTWKGGLLDDSMKDRPLSQMTPVIHQYLANR